MMEFTIYVTGMHKRYLLKLIHQMKEKLTDLRDSIHIYMHACMLLKMIFVIIISITSIVYACIKLLCTYLGV